jgi:hypothetical protein
MLLSFLTRANEPCLSRLIRQTAKEAEEETLLSEGRSVPQKVFDRTDLVRDVRLVLPAQTIKMTAAILRTSVSRSILRKEWD